MLRLQPAPHERRARGTSYQPPQEWPRRAPREWQRMGEWMAAGLHGRGRWRLPLGSLVWPVVQRPYGAGPQGHPVPLTLFRGVASCLASVMGARGPGGARVAQAAARNCGDRPRVWLSCRAGRGRGRRAGRPCGDCVVDRTGAVRRAACGERGGAYRRGSGSSARLPPPNTRPPCSRPCAAKVLRTRGASGGQGRPLVDATPRPPRPSANETDRRRSRARGLCLAGQFDDHCGEARPDAAGKEISPARGKTWRQPPSPRQCYTRKTQCGSRTHPVAPRAAVRPKPLPSVRFCKIPSVVNCFCARTYYTQQDSNLQPSVP